MTKRGSRPGAGQTRQGLERGRQGGERSRAAGAGQRQPGTVLSDDACPSCGATMKEARGVLRLTVNGEEVGVAGAVHLRCPRCREVAPCRLHSREESPSQDETISACSAK
jgi:uncharacterized C2H2 Zn-finger protein